MSKAVITSLLALTSMVVWGQSIPLPEHPRPDFERPHWINLNGSWSFAFDSLNIGIGEHWSGGTKDFPLQINVPFPWGAKLSGVADKADIAWYKRSIVVPADWKGKRVFVNVGASDWETTIWIDGQQVGLHQGGYTPFSFELTPYIKHGKPQTLVIRVDDQRRPFTLYGKQGYGNARGIWQTLYLEARGQQFVGGIRFTPDVDKQTVSALVELPEESREDLPVSITIQSEKGALKADGIIPKNKINARLSIHIPDAHLWSLDDPYLYQAEVQLKDDLVKTYFGMRKISVEKLPGSDHPYVAINGKPVYLQLTLDQSYHPEGFYTFPSDAFMREEIQRVKNIGLNGIRPHIKVEIPRKLYWADKLGVLVMADLPNSWGDPDERMQLEAETTLRKMIHRDYNHPSIFSWILFNETWGLRTHWEENGKHQSAYLPETQRWVVSMYHLAKSLDPTRLAEDNSICCGAGHTETDLNSFHDYLPGWEWENHLKNLTAESHEGSTFQFEAGFKQGQQPKINSECGNVWGYDGSTGDVDWSWDYHRMINTFRKYPEVAGWLYTEHHDVINEWNGYWRFDRSNKFTGVEELVPGMKVNDFHTAVYLSTGNEICRTTKGGETIQVPLYLSSMTATQYSGVMLENQLHFTNALGQERLLSTSKLSLPYHPYIQQTLPPLSITLPDEPGLARLTLVVMDGSGFVLHRNFMHVEVQSDKSPANAHIYSVPPAKFSNAQWSQKQWNVLDGLKVNGAGKGFFEYQIEIPANAPVDKAKDAYIIFEASAKELFVKDRDVKEKTDVDFMLGGKASPSGNPNSYPMTDETLFPSKIVITINGDPALTTTLADDPADHRGILSWHHQLQDRKLREAGSYGYLIKVPVSPQQLKVARASGKLTLRMTTQGDGGIAIYGKAFGRYPLDPSLVLITK